MKTSSITLVSGIAFASILGFLNPPEAITNYLIMTLMLYLYFKDKEKV